MDENKELTTGEKMVGITFNPSNLTCVAEIKTLCDTLINKLEQEKLAKGAVSNEYVILYNNALASIVEAQMNAVKLITFQY